MHDPAFDSETTGQAPEFDEAPPEFGLIDVVEAFTAMRHEWRGQTKESRAAIEAIGAAVDAIGGLEAKLTAVVAEGTQDESRKFVELIADADHHLSRASDGALQADAHRRSREEADLHAIDSYFDGMSAVARWFARPLLKFVKQQLRPEDKATENPATEGLNLVLARLRRSMKEHRIERIETLGQPFDGQTMNAIGTLETEQHPPGHVAEQLSAGYRWRGDLLRFADVRVAAARRAEHDGQPIHD